MRNFEERKAEVFRRSEKRIKARKQRRSRMLLSCIPLLVCSTLFAAWILPDMIPANEVAYTNTGGTGGLAEDKTQSLACVYSKIDVTGNGIWLSYTRASEVLRISGQLTSYMINEPESNFTGDEEIRAENFKDEIESTLEITGAATAAGEGYTITLTQHDGTTVVYRLCGNRLLDLKESQTYTLTQKQLEELNELLGIK